MQRTRACCQLRWHLHELDPDMQLPSRSLRQVNTRAVCRSSSTHGTASSPRMAGKLLSRIGDLSGEVKDIEKELTILPVASSPA